MGKVSGGPALAEVELAHVDSPAVDGLEEVDVERTFDMQNQEPHHGEAKLGADEGSRFLPMRKMVLIAMIGAGIQFGWALQLSLLTPYVETLGIPHHWVSFIWLCGPISGLLLSAVPEGEGRLVSDITSVRPNPDIFEDCWTRSNLAWGSGVTLVGLHGDAGGHSFLLEQYWSLLQTRPFACTLFIIGFWCLDLSNNTVQGPSRALLADLAGPDQQDAANALYSLWTAVGNILGYSTGTISSWYKWFPFLTSTACSAPCANLKAAYLIAILFLAICTAVTLTAAKEIPLPDIRVGQKIAYIDDGSDENRARGGSNGSAAPEGSRSPAGGEGGEGERGFQEVGVDASAAATAADKAEDQAGVGGGPASVMVNLLVGIRALPPTMKMILLVMALSWTAWFPFLLFDTDWMGREIFLGEPGHLGDTSEAAALYQQGVHEGALGLLLNSVVQALTSLAIDPLCRLMGAKNVWAAGNLLVCVCMAATCTITAVAVHVARVGGTEVVSHPAWVKHAALAIFAVLGAPFAITFSVPYALTAEFTSNSGGGQGLAMGILNLAIVLPQIVVALGAGPWDALFGGGNEPAFAAAAVFALGAGIVAWLKLPQTRRGGYVQFHAV
eukprot:jgi/Mesen1/2005/ME000147S01103